MRKKEALVSLSLAGIVLSLVLKSKLYILSGILLFIYLAFPRIADFIGDKFLALTRFLGKVLSSIFLTIVFCLILLPISFFYRLAHPNPLFLKVQEISSTFVCGKRRRI